MILLGGSFQRHYSCADSVPAPCAGNYCFMSVRPVIMAGRMWDYELCKCFLRKTCEWKWTRVFHVKMSHFYHAFRCHGRKFWRLKNEIINVSLAFFCLVVVVEDSLVCVLGWPWTCGSPPASALKVITGRLHCTQVFGLFYMCLKLVYSGTSCDDPDIRKYSSGGGDTCWLLSWTHSW